MKFLELVRARRSTRTYNGKKIDRKCLELCVEAARYAPSACNSQPWKFIVVDEPSKKDDLSNSIFSGIYKMNIFACTASAFIVIVSEKIKLPAYLGEKIMNTDYQKIDAGIACEHLVLQAQEIGIGTCILGWFNKKKLKKILSIPFNKKIELVIALGYPLEPVKKERRLKDKKNILSFNKY